MTLKQYEKRKESQKKLWLARVFAHSGVEDEDHLIKQALEKFEKDYPLYKNHDI